eukprot:UN16357
MPTGPPPLPQRCHIWVDPNCAHWPISVINYSRNIMCRYFTRQIWHARCINAPCLRVEWL